MQNRHYLETALTGAIQEKNPQEVRRLVKSIIASATASLAAIDEEGRSFLMLAIEQNSQLIAKLLIEKMTTYEAILSNVLSIVNIQNKSLLHLNSLYDGDQEFAITLIELCLSEKDLSSFLKKDNNGNTILHVATLSNRETLLHLLLTKLNEKIDNLDIFIHQVNVNGETALHVAMKKENPEIIANLINVGADLNLRNNAQIKPIYYFSGMSLDTQIKIFRLLSDKSKQLLLDVFRQFVIKYKLSMQKNDYLDESTVTGIQELKNKYFRLTGLYSMKSMLLGRHEFDDEIPIRNYYSEILRKSDKKNNHDQYDVNKREVFITTVLLNEMPLYKNKVEFAENEREGFSEYVYVESEQKRDQQSLHQLLDQDRTELTRLIADIDAIINHLNSKPTYSLPKRILSIAIPTLGTMSYITVETFCAVKLNQVDYRDDYEAWHQYSDCSIIFGMVGFLLPLTSIIPGFALWDSEPVISATEWLPVLIDLQTNLLDKLHELEIQQALQGKALVPTPTANIDSLDEKITALKKNQPLSNAITLFSQLKTTTESIRTDVNRSNRPISLFFQSVNKKNATSLSDENAQLLSKKDRNNRLQH